MPSTTSITQSSQISVWLLGLLLSTAVIGTWKVGQAFAKIEARLDSIERALYSATDDRWRGRDMRRWAKRLQELNPELRVPEPVLEKSQ